MAQNRAGFLAVLPGLVLQGIASPDWIAEFPAGWFYSAPSDSVVHRVPEMAYSAQAGSQ